MSLIMFWFEVCIIWMSKIWMLKKFTSFVCLWIITEVKLLMRKCKLSISYLLLTTKIKPFPLQLVNGLVCMFGVCTDFVQNWVYFLAYLIQQVCWIQKPCSNDFFKNSLCNFTMDKATRSKRWPGTRKTLQDMTKTIILNKV